MITIKSVYLECVIPCLNRRAFYLILAEIDLYGYMLIRKWGRIGTRGSPPLKMRFKNKKKLMAEFDRVLDVRFDRSYILCGELKEGRGQTKLKSGQLTTSCHQNTHNHSCSRHRYSLEDLRPLNLFQKKGDDTNDQKRID